MMDKAFRHLLPRRKMQQTVGKFKRSNSVGALNWNHPSPYAQDNLALPSIASATAIGAPSAPFFPGVSSHSTSPSLLAAAASSSSSSSSAVQDVGDYPVS